MMRQRIIFQTLGTSSSAWLSVLSLGAFFVLFGAFIFLYPEFLAFLFAGLMVFVGLGLIFAAIAMRPTKGKQQFLYRDSIL